MAEREEARQPEGLRRWQVYGLVLLLLVLSNVPLVCLVALWPGQADLARPTQFRALGWSWTIPPEQRILLCVAFCGLLGGSIRMLLRVRGDFISPQVDPVAIPWYFLTPPIGAILAVGFYLVVRGGFLTSGTSVQNVNVFAFGGTGVLVGLFAEVATDRLEGAFGSLFPKRRQSPELSTRHDSAKEMKPPPAESEDAPTA